MLRRAQKIERLDDSLEEEGRGEEIVSLIDKFSNLVSKESILQLYHQSAEHYFDIIEFLSKYANHQQEPISEYELLAMAVANNEFHVIPILGFLGVNIDAADADGRTLIHNAVIARSVKKLEILAGLDFNISAADNYGLSALHYAAEIGNMAITELLISNKADVNIQDEWSQETPVFFACRNNNIKTAKFLIENGADINHISKSLDSPLLIAARKSFTQLAIIILESSSNINESRDEAIIIAAKDTNNLLVKKLLLQKANVNAQGSDTNTALHYASFQNSASLTKLLLNHNASPHIQNWREHSALDIAKAMQHPNIITLLSEAELQIHNHELKHLGDNE